MEDDSEQTGQGGMTDDLMSRGRDKASQAMNDPDTQDQIKEQAKSRFGNVPGVSQAAGAFGTGGGTSSDQETGGDTSAPDDEGTDDTESS